MTIVNTLKKTVLILAVLGFSQFASAMDLQPASSKLNFVTVKNDRIAELMSFKKLTGSLNEKTGEAVIEIDLTSIDSGINIRDTRMQEFLFETANFAQARYTANVDMSMVKKLRRGQQQSMTLDGVLDLHGKTAAVSFEVLVTRLRGGAYHVATVAPAFVQAASFDLVGGIGKLKDIAKLGCIDLVVPVTFSVSFE